MCHVRRAVRLWRFELQQHAPVRIQAQAFIGERWTRAVTHELFESGHATRLVGREREPRMQVKPIDVRLQRPEHSLSTRAVSLGSNALQRRSSYGLNTPSRSSISVKRGELT